MKSVLTVIGTFIFGIFCEIFIRVVIIFYHQTEFNFSGLSGLPGFGWIVILGLGIFIATWISGMLTVTITHFSPNKHLLALFALYFLWRLSEFYGMEESSLGYSIGLILLQLIALNFAFIIKIKTNEQSTNS